MFKHTKRVAQQLVNDNLLRLSTIMNTLNRKKCIRLIGIQNRLNLSKIKQTTKYLNIPSKTLVYIIPVKVQVYNPGTLPVLFVGKLALNNFSRSLVV